METVEEEGQEGAAEQEEGYGESGCLMITVMSDKKRTLEHLHASLEGPRQ